MQYLTTIFLDLNRFNKKLKDTDAIEREKLVLEIELQDQTAPVEWTFNGQPIVPSDRIEIKNLGGGKHQLIFNKLEMGDDGEIMCESGKLQSSMQLTVKKGESKPIIDFPGTYEAPINKPIIMEVPYKGNQFPYLFKSTKSIILSNLVEGTRQTPVEAKLVKNDKVLGTKDVDVVVVDDRVTFKIKKPARELSGVYQIKLSNGQGEDVKDCNIVMQDVPGTPTDVDVMEVFQTSCVLIWKKPKDDGGAPILHYVIERQDISLKGKLT